MACRRGRSAEEEQQPSRAGARSRAAFAWEDALLVTDDVSEKKPVSTSWEQRDVRRQPGSREMRTL